MEVAAIEDEDDVDLGAEGDAEKPKGLSVKQKKKRLRFDRAIARDAGAVLYTIEADTVVPVPWPITWNEDPELLCCYNWQASTDGTNTIFVPGEPAKWQAPTLPHKLDGDSGLQYADYNYVRQPNNPYSPMFHALGAMNPDCQFMDVDVLADRNNLRVLLEFVQGKVNGPFRLDLFLVYNTLIIVRKEAGGYWKLSDGKSYGSNFERFFTRPAEGMEDATSHYRAIRYKMGPLNVVVRFEADAYDDGASDELTPSEAVAVSGGPAEKPHLMYRAPIRVLQKGHIVPTAQMAELKTQVRKPEGQPHVACMDQLWFGRTSILFTGRYEAGTGKVLRIIREDAQERIKKWEDNQQEGLRKLAGLLSRLRGLLKQQQGPLRSAVLVREDKGGPVVLRSMDMKKHAVDREFFQKHWRREPQPYAPQFGGPRGHGQQRGGRGMFNAPRGAQNAPRGGYGNPRGAHNVPRGAHNAPRGASNTSRGTHQSYSARGRGTGMPMSQPNTAHDRPQA
ncbi:hypothetical protein P153DRAFT_299913 [Dothidotthia symphoricarpi CBS 119687]|uniref:Geranylgeranyl pyrophosphate synthetase n=1 Tax=Dothidotthia symphoricarpi CBS 119687 TaxID=1392245 RepID=A0A6A6A3E4_9PLEO|nr:uncharacterized protein P153DRAFT_299913 [Dothidotthia symphoricarpi CBS 119687]KAF2125278.1 hypothetical protein P153DRAFT_299913 [Dothidotthia symphoricarpi CBS 119687]